MLHSTFDAPDVTTFTGIDQLGLIATGQRIDDKRAVIECRIVEPDPWCRRCGAEGTQRDSVTRKLAHTPFGHRPTLLHISIRRYRCDWCKKVWREDTSKVAESRAKISNTGVR